MAKNVGRPRAGYTDYLCEKLIDNYKERFSDGEKFSVVSDRNDPVYDEIKKELVKADFAIPSSGAIIMALERNKLKISMRWFFNSLNK